MANDVQYQGRVSKLYEARFGGGSFGLEGHDRQYFNTKLALPAFVQPGATIKFTAQVGRNNKSIFVTDATLEEVKIAGVPPQRDQGVRVGPSVDESIRYQSSRKDALVMVDMMLRNGALDLGKAVSKRAAIIEDAVDRFTAVYYEDVGTLGALDRTPPAEIPSGGNKVTESEGLPE